MEHTRPPEVESTEYFFLHCHKFVSIRKTLLNKFKNMHYDISNCSDSSLTELILYGNPNFSLQKNSDVINASMEYIIRSPRTTR